MQLVGLCEAGVKEIAIAVAYEKEQIVDYVHVTNFFAE